MQGGGRIGRIAKIPVALLLAMPLTLARKILRTLVEGHGAIIEGQSEIGRGSTFTVRLLVNRGKDRQEVKNSRKERRETKIQHMGRDSIIVDGFGFGSWWLFLVETRRA